MNFRCILLCLASSSQVWCDAPSVCEPGPEIREELRQAAARPISDPTAFDVNVAPFQALRDRHPDNVLAHEIYQDAVQRHGIEGHLGRLVEDYQALDLQHPNNLMYHYLAVRSLTGRATPAAIRGLTELLAENPEFAPAHRVLAEIYASEAFRDVENERTERQRFLALCPGSHLAQRPPPLPEQSPLLDQAERLLSETRDTDRVIAMTVQALKDDEWRTQRVRPFDWYSVDYKRENLRKLRAEYWRAWSIQVRCYRKAGLPDQASELLAQMDQRAMRLQKDPAYWDVLETLARLYLEGKQIEHANQKLNQMEQFLALNPDSNRKARLAALRSK